MQVATLCDYLSMENLKLLLLMINSLLTIHLRKTNGHLVTFKLIGKFGLTLLKKPLQKSVEAMKLSKVENLTKLFYS